jgi:hypothetical protein
VLKGAAMGAASAAVSVGLQKIVAVSEVSAIESQGDIETGVAAGTRSDKPDYDRLTKDNKPVKCGEMSTICGSMKDGLSNLDKAAIKQLTATPFEIDGTSYDSMLAATRRSHPRIEFNSAVHEDGSVTVLKGGRVRSPNAAWGRDSGGMPHDSFTAHTHPNSRDVLSVADIKYARTTGVPIYAIAPNGYIITFDPNDRVMRNIGWLRP